MKTNGGFLVTKIKQLGDRIFEKILSEKNIDDNISYDDAGKNGKSRADKPCSV